MTEDTLNHAVRNFLDEPFNIALLVSAGLFTLVASIYNWMIPVIMILWLVILYGLKEVRELYPNRSKLVFFIIISIILYQYIPEFGLAGFVLGACLFVPEEKWNILKK